MITFISRHRKIFMILLFIIMMILLLVYFQVDIRAIALLTLIAGYVTKLFVGLSTLIAALPIIGPLIIKVISLPIVWLMNGLGYFTSLFAIKKGYGRDVMNHRIITLVLFIGIILGYILGHLIPLK